MTAQELIASGKGTIVDVRSYIEYSGGHIAGSKNIPLDQLSPRLYEIETFETPLLVVCSGGNRSAMATKFLKGQGYECIDGGSWLSVNFFVSLK